MAETAAAATGPSPYKEPSRAEVLERRRRLMLLPLFTVPLGISAYFAFGKEKAQGVTWFSLHPFLMMSAFFTLTGVSALTKKIGGKDNTILHGNLMALAAAVASFGGYVIWSNKEMYNKAHLTTTHGQVGALSLTLLVSYVLPSYLLYYPDAGFLRTNALARKIHKYTGRITIALGLITCAYGILSMEKDSTKSAILIGSLLATTPGFLL